MIYVIRKTILIRSSRMKVRFLRNYKRVTRTLLRVWGLVPNFLQTGDGKRRRSRVWTDGETVM